MNNLQTVRRFVEIEHSPKDPIFRDLLESVFSVVSAPDNNVQSKLDSLTKVAGF